MPLSLPGTMMFDPALAWFKHACQLLGLSNDKQDTLTVQAVSARHHSHGPDLVCRQQSVLDITCHLRPHIHLPSCLGNLRQQ
jgi:hypothetical protein